MDDKRARDIVELLRATDRQIERATRLHQNGVSLRLARGIRPGSGHHLATHLLAVALERIEPDAPSGPVATRARHTDRRTRGQRASRSHRPHTPGYPDER
jgi:hypothetical protein